ncbi:hypothetical protein [Archaeoglobus profundus]|uniref:Uncharacterized protein n=1 Tax=Archaeoglobus profundus (strain DSM 5631 / JCM 9629 / NBRC 100127 / Av18) TaxID=572546 RepID=D2RHZ7_ARCPA|nr:hypothetical protein [Archaeoglobus profundus]ADB57922.1 hypothetical protein Arcpr_0859 [Archaeoglobus profundus DSM 5631]
MGDNEVSLEYLNGNSPKIRNKFVEIALDYENEFREHIEEYKNAVFPSEKLRILEDAVEKLIKCVVYLKKSITVQESKENFIKELESVFDRENDVRSAIVMSIFARRHEKPADLRAIARWVYGTDDKNAVDHVRRVVKAFVEFGVLEVAEENPLKVLPNPLYASLIRKRFLAGIYEAAETLIVR